MSMAGPSAHLLLGQDGKGEQQGMFWLVTAVHSVLAQL